jgi:hypothetical protein
LKIHLNIILPSMPRSFKWFFPSSLTNATLYARILSRVRATCPVHLILLPLIIQIIFGEE